MHIRYLKIMFAALTGFMALIYVIQNFANFDVAHQTILYVMSGAEQTVYQNTFAFYSDNALLAWIALIIICGCELAAGGLMLKGALNMWKNRSGDSNDFSASMKLAQIGAGIGVFVWLGLFGVFGAALFQMWQTQIGEASMNGAFQYFVTCAITLIFLCQNSK